MVELAVAGNPLFSVDSRELLRDSPSFTIETLEALRKERGAEQPLAFIIGQDSLLSLHKWHRWQALLDVPFISLRPARLFTVIGNTGLQQWLESHKVMDPQALSQRPHGAIYLADTPLLDISATDIRRRRHNGELR